MNIDELQQVLTMGENEYVEFKRCSNNPGSDIFETICSFANGFGGTIFLGVEDDGVVRGIEATKVLPIMRNIHNVINNPNTFDIPIAIGFEHIDTGGRQVVKITVPNSPQVHSFKGKVYIRKADSDTVMRGSIPLAELYIRKQGIFTERRVIEHVSAEDLRADLIDEARKLARIKRKDHPWQKMTDLELLESAGLFGKDYTTGKRGYTLAAVLALGKDEVIRSVCPTYKTDAIARIADKDRYDDRLTITTNLMDAYTLLASFCRKHLPDRFLLEGDQAISPRDIIIRELMINCLIHREFTSPSPAKVIIDPMGIHTENASRASFEGPLEPDAFAPLPKNPTLSSFFCHIGLAEELGSGTREIFRCSHLYTGREPELEEGIVFKAFVPTQPATEEPPGTTADPDDTIANILKLAERPEGLRTAELVTNGRSSRTAQRIIHDLVEKGLLVARGKGRQRRYHLP